MTKEQIIAKMVDEMPFNLPEHLKPYLLEAMDLYAKQSKDSLIANIEKRIEELRKEYNKFYFEEDAEIRAQILMTISELQSLLKTARE